MSIRVKVEDLRQLRCSHCGSREIDVRDGYITVFMGELVYICSEECDHRFGEDIANYFGEGGRS